MIWFARRAYRPVAVVPIGLRHIGISAYRPIAYRGMPSHVLPSHVFLLQTLTPFLGLLPTIYYLIIHLTVVHQGRC
jgi:hypothetical protein